jgi:hypothetical protein
MGRKVARKVATGSLLRADACTCVVFEFPPPQGTSPKNPSASCVPLVGPNVVLGIKSIPLRSRMNSRRNAFGLVEVIQDPGQTEDVRMQAPATLGYVSADIIKFAHQVGGGWSMKYGPSI